MVLSSNDLPPGTPHDVVRRISDGVDIVVLSVTHAAKIAGVARGTVQQWVDTGQVTICYTRDSEVRVLADSLWAKISGKRG